MGDGYIANGSHQGTSEMLETENDRLSDELKDKVSALKFLSIDIGQEVRDQNKFLNDMDNDFDSSGNILRSTMNRVVALGKAGHNRFIIYLLLFALFVFFICWLILKSRWQ